MVKFAPVYIALAAILTGGSCTITEMTMAHDNPLDRIFDSGSYRLVLTADSTAANATLAWSSVFYTNDKGKVTELTTSDITVNGTAQLLYSATAPSASDINAVKQGGVLAYTPVTTLATAGAGNFTTTAAGFKGYYIIRLDYKYDGKTGRIYSNYAVAQ